MTDLLHRILPGVQKPARYTGGEFNEIQKDPDSVRVNVAFCFPDTYEIGMSNVGMRILYGVMNAMEGVWCQRVFAPWGDMEEEMRREGLLLYGLESGDPIADFDLIVPQDNSNYEDVIQLATSPDEMAKVVPMSAWFADDCPLHAVPDPYYGTTQDFDDVVSLLAGAARQLANDIARAES